MNSKKIVITGAAGFVGSAMVAYLNEQGVSNLILVDDFSHLKKVNNFRRKQFEFKIHRSQFVEWLEAHYDEVASIIHLGARTDTMSKETAVFKELNVDFTQRLFRLCAEHEIPFVYASSAATYGLGEAGYTDNEQQISTLKPLNEYAKSKQVIDEWALQQQQRPPFWAGLKFFNVYGPNEYHKKSMASVVYHSYKQIIERGYISLFKSHNPDYKDGGQMRDFIYVKDVLKVIHWLLDKQPESGIYNVGTGTARTFSDLVEALMDAINHKTEVRYIDTPEHLRPQYQYFTEANMDKLREAGYDEAFMTIEEGVKDYAINYLEQGTTW